MKEIHRVIRKLNYTTNYKNLKGFGYQHSNKGNTYHKIIFFVSIYKFLTNSLNILKMYWVVTKPSDGL